MAKLLFVVHRYYPYPGGSENYVRWMAEEMKARGADVTVFAGDHKGDQNGIRVTDDKAILSSEKFDLIIVHGADVPIQNFVLVNAASWSSPVLYMIILPSDSIAAELGMQNSKYLGWSTEEDIQHIFRYGHHHKAVNIRHGVPKMPKDIAVLLPDEIRNNLCIKYGIDPTKKIFLSCGGYWPNKGMKELAEVFIRANVPDTVLVTTGYGGYQDLIPDRVEGKVYPIVVEEQEEIGVWMLSADLYIMHSVREGFGLVLLEAMQRLTPWIARHMAGAAKLINGNGSGAEPLGTTYLGDDQLIKYMREFSHMNIHKQVYAGYAYVNANHLISNTCDDIDAVLTKEITNG